MKKCSYCGRDSDDVLVVCPECGTALPGEPYQSKPPRIGHAQVRRRALLSGVFQALFAMGVLIVGWIYPAWFISKDPIMRNDTDPRLGPAVELSIAVGLVFAVLAGRSFWRAGRRD